MVFSHRGWIALSGLLVFAYAISVLAYVWNAPEIGITANFRNTVNRIDPDFVADSSAARETLAGWSTRSVGDEQVASWAQFVRAVHDLDQLDWDSLAGRPTYRRGADGIEWVRVDLEHEGQTREIWCRVGRVAAWDILPSVLWFVLEIGLFLIGAIVYWKRPNDVAARMFYLQSLVVIGAYMGGYHWSRIATQPILTSAYIVCATMLPAANLHFFLLFPSPKRWMYRRPGIVLSAVYSVPGVFLALLLASYSVIRWLLQAGAPADQVNAALGWIRDLAFTYFGVAAAWYLASIAALVHSYRSAKDATERNQTRLILISSLLAAIPFGYAISLASWHPAAFTSGAAMWPLFAASACFTFAYAVGITRYRLLQVDQLLSSSIIYFLISGLAALIYCALVVTGMLLFGSRGPSLEQAAWVGGSALVLTISLDVARSRLRNYLDRRFRKDKTQLDHILQQLGGAVGQLIDTPTLARRLLSVSADLHGCPRGAIYIRDGVGGFKLVGELGSEGHPERLSYDNPLLLELRERVSIDRLSLPPVHPVRQNLATLRGDVAVGLMHVDQLLGAMILGRAPGRLAGPADAKLLASFAPVAALALAGAEVRGSVDTLNRELQAKVNKISEQQRRIFSLQQQLIAQSRRFPTPDAAPPAAAQQPRPTAPLETLIGSSPALQKVLDVVPKVAANTSAVLIRGESGTGKELLARALHELSPRSSGPYVKVHCAALAPGLLESELFGHVKGSFTGAVRDKPGRFETASGGTIFLDEIGDISGDVQTKLLRVIQEKTFERVGSNEPVRVDVRLVTATHQDLEKLIADGRFRADLYYRLNVISLELPALRERGEDVLELAHHFLRLHSARCHKSVESIDDDALVALREYAWPGNIRELENVIERAVVVCDKNSVTSADLPPHVWQTPIHAKAEQPLPMTRQERNRVRIARAARHSRERAEILQVLEETDGNRSEAALRLGIARSTLISRMKKFGLLDVSTG